MQSIKCIFPRDIQVYFNTYIKMIKNNNKKLLLKRQQNWKDLVLVSRCLSVSLYVCMSVCLYVRDVVNHPLPGVVEASGQRTYS